MTDNEIIKALECCVSGGEDDCLLCPLREVEQCTYERDCATADLINRQKAEIERLREAKVVFETVDYSSGDLEDALKEIEALRKSHDELIAKNREQEEEIAHLKCVSIVGEVREIPLKMEKLACISWEHTLVKAVKAEAIKEFAERLKEHFDDWSDNEKSNTIYVRCLIDNLVEEMTEVKKLDTTGTV